MSKISISQWILKAVFLEMRILRIRQYVMWPMNFCKLSKMSYLSHKKTKFVLMSCMNQINNCVFTFSLRIVTNIMHFRFNFDACPVYLPFGFVHLTHQNLMSPLTLFCHNPLEKGNTQLLISK